MASTLFKVANILIIVQVQQFASVKAGVKAGVLRCASDEKRPIYHIVAPLKIYCHASESWHLVAALFFLAEKSLDASIRWHDRVAEEGW